MPPTNFPSNSARTGAVLPENMPRVPRPVLGAAYQNSGGLPPFLGMIANAAASASGIPGLGLVTGALGGGSGAGLSQMRLENERLLMLQMQVQQVSLEFSTRSNMSKTAHDAEMNSVRNIRS